MTNPFFKNKGPFTINKLLNLADLNNIKALNSKKILVFILIGVFIDIVPRETLSAHVNQH